MQSVKINTIKHEAAGLEICMDVIVVDVFVCCRMFAGVVPRVLWISFGGFVFLGAYEKFSVYLQTWQNLPSHSHGR